MNKSEPVVSENNTSIQLLPTRIAAIRETLSLHGTKMGMLHLLENGRDAANWLLKQFGTPAKIEEWLSQQTTIPS